MGRFEIIFAYLLCVSSLDLCETRVDSDTLLWKCEDCSTLQVSIFFSDYSDFLLSELTQDISSALPHMSKLDEIVSSCKTSETFQIRYRGNLIFAFAFTLDNSITFYQFLKYSTSDEYLCEFNTVPRLEFYQQGDKLKVLKKSGNFKYFVYAHGDLNNDNSVVGDLDWILCGRVMENNEWYENCINIEKLVGNKVSAIGNEISESGVIQADSRYRVENEFGICRAFNETRIIFQKSVEGTMIEGVTDASGQCQLEIDGENIDLTGEIQGNVKVLKGFTQKKRILGQKISIRLNETTVFCTIGKYPIETLGTTPSTSPITLIFLSTCLFSTFLSIYICKKPEMLNFLS